MKTIEEIAEEYIDNFQFDIAHPKRVCKKAFINGYKLALENICNSEMIQKIRGTKSDAEARRIIKYTL